MAMRIIKNAYTKVGEYTDLTGATKARYLNIGKLFKRDDGSISLKVDSLPVGAWEGWINFSDPLPRDDHGAPAASHAPSRANYAPPPGSPPPAAADFDDDIPF
jgi:hypothetical protein